jgi:hypothetical protein
MAKRKKRDRFEGLPEVKTPVIDIQDLERNPGPDTRVDNSGVSARPKSRQTVDEEAFKELPPG